MNGIQQEAISLLLESKIKAKFPIDSRKIAEKRGYIIVSYTQFYNVIIGLNIYDQVKQYDGFSIKYNDKFYIAISDEVPSESEHIVIAHEIGHIMLHYLKENLVIGKKPAHEKEADKFALAFLAPASILYKMETTSINDIKKKTGLSNNQSKVVLEDIEAYCRIISEYNLHKKIKSKFRGVIIRSSIEKNIKLAGTLWTIILLIFITLMSIFIIAVLVLGNNKKINVSPSFASNSQTQSIPYIITNSSSSSNNNTISSTPNTQEVFWTPSGNKYHLFRDCQYLKNSTKVINGSSGDAIKNGKDDLCSACKRRAEK